MNKILLITNIPTPYRIPLFNELKSQLAHKGLKLKVVFGALDYSRRKWEVDMSECEFEYEVLRSKPIPTSDPERYIFTYPGLIRITSKEKPYAFITIAFCPATTKLWFHSWFKKTPYIIWSGAVERKDKPDSLSTRLRRKALIKRAAGFIAYGSKAKEYLVALGADENKVHIGINTVDTQFFKEETQRIRENLVPLNKKKHLLYVGDLSPRKNVIKVLKVIKKLSKSRSDFMLDIVGDGEEGLRLKKYVSESQLTELVKFHGFKQKSSLPKCMAQSDCFLFQTDFDIWGLVLVEAMAAGLPCISSVHACSTLDLIKEGKTGFALDFSETEKVAEKIQWILDNPELAKKIGENASRYVSEKASIKYSASGFLRAISNLMNSNKSDKFQNLAHR